MPIKKLFIAGSLAFMSTACQTTQLVPINEIYQSTHCGYLEPAIIQIRNQAELTKATRRNQVMLTEEKNSKPITANFAMNNVFLISNGEQPNSGYNITLEKDQAIVKSKTLHLPITFTSPAPDKLYLQMITRNCKIITAKKAEYNNVSINNTLTIKIQK